MKWLQLTTPKPQTRLRKLGEDVSEGEDDEEDGPDDTDGEVD